MLGGNFKEVLLRFVDAKCLSKRHGGELENISENYFPPDMSIEG